VARDRVIRDCLRQKLDSNCGRCFRSQSACPGPSAAGKPSPCSVVNGANYIPTSWSHALKSMSMWLTADTIAQKQMVTSFYTHNGLSFGDFDDVVTATFVPSTRKSASSSYVDYCRREVRSERSSAAVFTVTPRVAMLRRCLSILPDSGNPVILAGLCWWLEYACLLHNAGLLTGIRKVASKEAMSFGDADAVVPHFILLQVPLWYRYKSQGAQLVSTDIRIVQNEAGLLDGKHNMAALNFTMALSATVGKTSYSLRTRALRIVDSGSHVLVRLAKPRPFRENESGIAVVRANGIDSLHAVIVPTSEHFIHHEVAREPTIIGHLGATLRRPAAVISCALRIFRVCTKS
jgi:hypothetical protein